MNKIFNVTLMAGLLLGSCTNNMSEKKGGEANAESSDTVKTEFAWQIDRFDDFKILRYQIPEFESLSLKQKELLYYLGEAAKSGRDILYDQNYKHNLSIRRTLEAIYLNYEGDKSDADYLKFETYLKKVWLANGIHHHYSTDKFKADFSKDFFKNEVLSINPSQLPLSDGENAEALIEKLTPIIFDDAVDAKRVNQADGQDIVVTSANNYYEGVTQAEAEAYYDKIQDKNDKTPVWYGLNSKMVKENGEVKEITYKLGGLYGKAIEKIMYWLEKAETVAENEKQKSVIADLIQYYKTGDLEQWDTYNINWVQDTASRIDFVNGFIEVYGDPLARKASWESVVNFKNIEATKRSQILSDNAQWFEDHSPVNDKYKKEEVKGVTAKVINVTTLGGDCYPTTPIGINLPNSSWIRRDHGSKSVTIENVMYAYEQSSLGSGSLQEFAYSEKEIERAKESSFLSHCLHVDLHECLGHGSGKLLPNVSDDALRNYHSAIEEARADLFALYYGYDQKLVDLGLMPSLETGKAEYDSYIRGGLMLQLKRIELGKDIEESHMRNRQLIAKWAYEKGKAENVIEKKVRDGKTFFVINDYEKLRDLFGQLLALIQEIKSEGKYEQARELIEKYAVKVDYDLHKEVLERYEKLDLPSYSGFVNPELVPVYDGDEIIDVNVKYVDNYADQQIKYSTEYSFLPNYN